MIANKNSTDDEYVYCATEEGSRQARGALESILKEGSDVVEEWTPL